MLLCGMHNMERIALGKELVLVGIITQSIYPVLQQLSPSSGNQTPFLSVSPLIWF